LEAGVLQVREAWAAEVDHPAADQEVDHLVDPSEEYPSQEA